MEQFMQTAIHQQAYHFEKATKDSAYYVAVCDEFNSVIAPIYGNQDEALIKIAAATDRICEVLIEDLSNKIAGILVYKSHPIDEFASFGVHQALELKTLFVVDAANQSGKGIGSRLIERVKNVAFNEGNFEAIVVTVSDEKPESQDFFAKKEFVKIASFAGKYKAGVVEALYACRR
jgi:ribosomal protein S18 acetylase RimI-like enzyme